MNKDTDLTRGHIGRQILLVALPLIVTNLLQVSYNFVDMFFIGMYYPSGEGVTALGTAGNYQWLASSYIMFVTIGTQVLIAQMIGAKKHKKEIKYVHNGIVFGTILALLYTLVTFAFSEQLIYFYNLSSDFINEIAIEYLRILSIGLFFLMLNMVLTAIYQAKGKTNIVFFVIMFGVIANIILDPLFIFYFDMGAVGAAYASTIGAGLSTLLYIVFLKYTSDYFNHKIVLSMKYVKDIFNIGKFVGTQNVLFTFSAMIISTVIVWFGDEAIGAQRIGAQVESFTWMIGGGISAVMASFAGQNYGARDLLRITIGYRFTMIIMTIYGFVITLAFFIYGDVLISLFTDNPTIIEIGAVYMKIISLSQLGMLYEGISGGVFNGFGKSKYVAIYGISGNVLRVVLVYVLALTIGINGIWIAISLSSIYKGFGLTVHLLRHMKKYYNVKIRDIVRVKRTRNMVS